YTFRLDPAQLERNYLSAAYVGMTLRTAIAGVELTKIIRNEKEIKLIATFDQDYIPDLASIQNLQILNTRRQPVYLKDVAKIELEPAVDVITRIDQKRVVLLSAGVDSTTDGQTVVKEFQTKTADYVLPNGYSIVYGGEN